jgi:hypothetical protein
LKCAICNATLSPGEIQWNSDHNDWDPCGRCLDVIDNVFSDDTEEEIDAQLAFELGDEEETYEPFAENT